MTLAQGTKLGPYEVLSTIGAGGMGEVYRAKDPRLGREVALKVLPASIALDADRLRRFESEARAASALNHPNIVTVHDIGKSDGTTYMAMELVDGASLRQMLAGGPLGEKKMLELSVQIADGLAKAHTAGIVHRDLKPENVMVSKDGFVKILDFGLAKPFTAPGASDGTAVPTMAGETQPGTVLGTVGYMSPEQASGRPVDYRSDQFALGSILYEMATGQRAFQKPTGAETLSAIIREEPEPVSRVNPRAPAPYRWIVERCLAKDPEDRYASTRDLARDLKSVREHVSEVTSTASGASLVSAASPKRRTVAWWVAAAALVLGAFGGALVQRGLASTKPPKFHQLTFRRGAIRSARLAPDGQTILYSAGWDGQPAEVYLSRLDSPESRALGLTNAEVLSISPSGEMAVALNSRGGIPGTYSGTLARLGMTGAGTPKEIVENVMWADWAPDGQNLAVVRQQGGKVRLEYPVGKVLYETAGWISNPRISARGDEVAFIDHPVEGDDGGSACIVDRAGKRRAISELFASAQGLAWSPDGSEVWLTAVAEGNSRALQAVSRSGRTRILAQATGLLTIQDVSKTGRVLMIQETGRQGMSVLLPGSERERDFSWLDWSLARDMTADGQMILFDESGEGGGSSGSVYVRKADGSPAVRLGPGSASRFSPDGRSALAIKKEGPLYRLVVYPIGPGEPKLMPVTSIRIEQADWLADGRRIIFSGSEPDRGSRIWIQGLEEPKPRPFSPEGYRMFEKGLRPDGKAVAASGPDQRYYFYPVEGGEPTPILGLVPGDRPSGWTADGRFLFVRRRENIPQRVMKLELATGRKELWRELMPADPAGIWLISPVWVAPDEKHYTYSFSRSLADLYVLDGVR